MFGLSVITMILLIVWGGITIGVTRLDTQIARGLRIRWLTSMLGAVVIIGAFFFQPWIRLDFVEYIDPTPEFLEQLIPKELTLFLARHIGVQWISKFVQVFLFFTRLNGWKIQLLPTIGLFTRAATLLPLLPLALGLLTVFIGSMYRGKFLAKILGYSLIGLSLLSLILLLIVLPDLDALGIRDQFHWSLFAAILGVRLGNGPWLCIVGLLLLCLGGVVEIVDTSPEEVLIQ
jgi:hypothetical protein